MTDSIKNPDSVSMSAGHRDGVSPTPWRVADRMNETIVDALNRVQASAANAKTAAIIVEAVNNYEVLIQERRRLIGELDAAKSEVEYEKLYSKTEISRLISEKAELYDEVVEIRKERDRLRDTNRSYGETIVQLNEAAQRSELKAMRLGDLIHRLSDCILGAHLEGLDGPFHARYHLAHCPNVTDNDGMEVLNGDVAEALTVLAQAQAILREARETTGKDEP